MVWKRLDGVRDTARRLAARLRRSQVDHLPLLQAYSRKLTSCVSVPRLLEVVATYVDQAFQPEGVAIVLAGDDQGYRVRWSQGHLAEQGVWRMDSTLTADHPLVRWLEDQYRPLDLSRRAAEPPEQDPRWSEIARSGAGILAPMHIRGTLLGWVALGRRPTGYTRRDLELLGALADQAGVILENARLYAVVTRERDQARRLYEEANAALRLRVEELTVIEKISRQLTGTLDLDEVLDRLLRYALQATGADRGVIALYLPGDQNLQLTVQHGYPATLDRYRTELWPADQGITGRVARTLRPALVPDVSQDPDYIASAATTRSQLSVPILHQEQLMGIITLESDQLAAFGPENLRFAGLLADHAAIAIYNAQLFEQVMEGRERLQAILNSISDVVIVQDMEGRVILVNPRLREVFGSDIEELLRSTPLYDDSFLQAPLFQEMGLDVTAIAKAIRQVVQYPDQEYSFTFSFHHEPESWCYVEGVSSPVLGVDGEVIGRLTVLRDITHQKEMDRFRTELTSMIIHNLQGPLAAILSSLEMLHEDPHLDRETRSELLRIALSSGRKLYERIESLLWIRRLEDKQIPLELYTLPLPQVVQPVVDEYIPLAVRSGVRLEAVYAPDLPPVLVDEDVIGRVVSNLLDNALKFTPEGGRIHVAVRRALGAEGDLLCSVTDDGVGIPPHLQGAIFDRFRRGTVRGRRRGMGLGLYYCKVAVEAHGGRIWVESQAGEGSTFFFTLPPV